MLCGGASAARPATDETQRIADEVSSAVCGAEPGRSRGRRALAGPGGAVVRGWPGRAGEQPPGLGAGLRREERVPGGSSEPAAQAPFPCGRAPRSRCGWPWLCAEGSGAALQRPGPA